MLCELNIERKSDIDCRGQTIAVRTEEKDNLKLGGGGRFNPDGGNQMDSRKYKWSTD